MNRTISSGRARRVRRALAILAVPLAVGACDALDNALSVEAPGVIDAEDVPAPQNADVLVSGAIADFECALGAYIVNSAVLGNELADASVTAARFPLDARIINASSPYGTNSCTNNPPGIYRPLSTAIWSSNEALELLDGWTDQQVDNRTGLIAKAAAYSGYSHTLLGEGFCSAVIEPLGEEVQEDAVFERAVERFDRAIQAAEAVGDEDILNLAQLGRARAHLNLGNLSLAAADARAVLERDPRYEKFASASAGGSSRRYNRLGNEFYLGRVTVAPSYRGLTVAGEPDPRVEVLNTETEGHDSETLVWLATKVGSELTTALRGEPVPIASWREAHLIIAEAEGGDEAVRRINILRGYWDLPTFSSNDPAEIRAQVIEERARELFLEGHHLNDLRRFDVPLTPAPGEEYRQGGLYGDVSCFPLPAVERNNNPNVSRA